MKPNPDLSQSLDRVYSVFARYPRPIRMETSPVYGGKDFLRPLTAAPLRDLSCDDVGLYAGKALTTVGVESDYKHFLPRLLEHVVSETCPYLGLDPDEFARKLIYGAWSGWPDEERHAILAVFRLAAEQSVNEPPELTEADSWAEALALLERAT